MAGRASKQRRQETGIEGGLRVLIAEDDGAVAAALARQLAAMGHQVVGEAVSGRQAVALATELAPDVVVMDIKMPDGDGIEAARELTRVRPMPVVFLSGHFDQGLLAGVAGAGGLAYLLKPVTADQLQAAMTLAYQRFREMSDLREQAARLEEALEARKLVSRAKGLIMERHKVSEEEAHRWLQKEASRSNLKLADLARSILAAGTFVGATHKDAGKSRSV